MAENVQYVAPGANVPGALLLSQSDTKPRVWIGVVAFLGGVLLTLCIVLFFLYREAKETRQSMLAGEAAAFTQRYELSLQQHESLLNTLLNQSVIDDRNFQTLTPQQKKRVVLSAAVTFNAAVDTIFKRRWTVNKDTVFKYNPPQTVRPK